jgi:hypothetical protein
LLPPADGACRYLGPDPPARASNSLFVPSATTKFEAKVACEPAVSVLTKSRCTFNPVAA